MICKGHIMQRDGHVLGCIHALAGLTHPHANGTSALIQQR